MRTVGVVWAGGVCSALLVVVAFQVSTLNGLAVLMLASAALVMAAIAGGVRRHRPAFARAWWLIFTSVGLALAGNVIFATLLPTSISTNGAAINIIYGITYPILCAGVALLPNHGRRGAAVIGLTESAIIACGAAVIWWMVFVDPTLIDTGAIDQHAYLLVEPFLDLVLLGFGVRLLLLSDSRSVSYWLVAASCVVRLTADTAYLTVGSSAGFPTPVSIVGWVVGNGLLTVAALHPSMKRTVALPDGQASLGGHGGTRIYVGTVVAVPILTGLFLLREGLNDTLGSLDVVVPMIATAITSALVVQRMRQLNRVAAERAADLETALCNEAELQRELRFRSEHDVLTSLPMRSVLHDRLAAALDSGRPGALLLLDLDGFKDVNDRFGHAVGDELLVAVSARLRELFDGALVARLHSDEFAALLEDAPLTDAWATTERVLTAMRRPLPVQGHELFATVSMGLRELEPGLPAADVSRDAYLALHAAKEAGRNQFVLYDDQLREKRLATARTVERLREALTRDEFLVHYQPLIRLADEHIAGVEALIRWQPAGEKMVPPDRFIGVSEDSGLIVPIGAWVLREACRVVAGWHHRHGTVISVNVSPRQLREPGFGLMVLDALQTSGLPPQALILEITEGVLVDSGLVTEQAISHLSMLRSHGVRVAVDDFGTGYSSLAYLRDLPIDHVKIDRSFMPAPGQPDPAARTLVKAIIDLASGLRLGTIAEGVETAEQVQLLRELGCERAQGFYFSRPVPEADAARLIGESRDRLTSG
ncbi:bifunctional diguanylate cyclase/phosphodiesterase [Actinoplanes sp. Pm04-4]|uniref:Bifunctional diguanylate cyclase/phosphodiesterase n=1 Tax=Paractinoplanes pyxinae TaxID=2997416 RepID=A0ABT4ARS2_9ACTN|nr:bifunctional diguanylate cyclase/phosphodiesterase [Actinoplanes pyxinae]MCY1136924.1 bifunctional diguanylate cyclase/phosphodiesterase [Actinoplanes pyxinae]